MSDNASPLNKLVVRQEAVDEELLSRILAPYVQLHLEPPKVEFTWDGEQLTTKQKIIVYLLGRKALAQLLPDDVEYAEAVAPSIISDETNIPGGSVRPTLSQLRDRKLVRNGDGYRVPNNALRAVQALFDTEE